MTCLLKGSLILPICLKMTVLLFVVSIIQVVSAALFHRLVI